MRVDRGSIVEPCVVRVDYRTIEGAAKENSDFEPTSGVLRFEPHESRLRLHAGELRALTIVALKFAAR